MIHGHGGNVHALARRLGCPPAAIVDASSNVNPYGPMDGLIDHLQGRLEVLAALPPPDAEPARRAFARSLGLAAEQVVAGCGTTQLIHLMPGALGLKKALVTGPTYADYADACTLWAIECRHVLATADDGFAPPLHLLEDQAGQADVVFVCNPNNPTGQLCDPHRLHYVAARHPATLFVVDESYLPFVDDMEEASLAGCRLPNVVVLHSLSKIHRLPGLRLGLATADRLVAAKLAAWVPPWSVNALAHEALCFIAEHRQEVRDFIRRSRKACRRQVEEMAAMLTPSGRLEVFATHGPFFLCRLTAGHRSAPVARHMADAGILIRDCANFIGLDDTYIRLSVKRQQANRAVCRRLLQVLEQEPVP